MPLVPDFRDYLQRVFSNPATIDSSPAGPANHSHLADEPPSRTCRFRLDNNSSATITLPDGRKLGYAQYGSLTGHPILFQHGLPGSRAEAAYFEEMGLKLGARIIAADRPGYGWSSPHPGRTLLDFPKDLEHLAEHLKLGEYSVMGVSGGGPYALACAFALPRNKLKAVSIICGLGPPDIGMGGADWFHQVGFTIGYRYFPTLTKWYLSRQTEARLDLTDEERLELLQQRVEKGAKAMPKKDFEIMKDDNILQLSLRTARESFARGCDAMVEDGILEGSDWGFRIEDISPDLHVHLWYGEQDTSVPLNHGRQIASRLGNRARLQVEAETHFSMFINWREEALKHLIEANEAQTKPVP